jgi:two-component system nitrate/nitrite sensor histidine kinase NarX
LSETRFDRDGATSKPTGSGESERMFRTIVETTAEGVLIGRPDGVITYVNLRMADLLGYRPDDLVGMSGLELLFPGWEPTVLQNRAALQAGEILRGELQLRRRDGSALWTHFSASPLFDEKGRHIANLNLHADITARVHAEQALRRQADELRAALERAQVAERASLSAERMLAEVGDAVIAVDSEERVTYMNDQAVRQYAVPREAAIGQPLGDVVRYEWTSPAQEHEALGALRRTGRWRGENVHVSGDGRRLEVEAAVSILRHEDGTPAGTLAVIRDVSERKEAERVLRAHEAEAAALAERNRLARDLHDSVTQTLFAASLKAESLAGDGCAAPLKVAQTAEEVRRLTRGALAQMRTMLLELRSDPVCDIPLQMLLAQLVEAAESRAGVDVTLRVRGEARPPAPVHEAVYRIVQEALNNVVRHARAASAWVELELQPDAIHLIVGDDGCGFDPAQADPAGLGLRAMRERAVEAGLDLHVGAGPAGGTVVAADWCPAAAPGSTPPRP